MASTREESYTNDGQLAGVEPTLPVEEEPRLAESHRRPLAIVEILFGIFTLLMVFVTVPELIWHGGSWHNLAVLLGFLLANLIFSAFSVRSSNPRRVEIGRSVLGGALALGSYLLVEGPLHPWWPGFLIMCLSGSIILGVLTQSPVWSRLVVAYYLVLLALATVIDMQHPNLYQLGVIACVVGCVGILFIQLMTLLIEALQAEHRRTRELIEARDAMAREIAVAQEIQQLILPVDPWVPGSKVCGRTVPANEIGGDYYDVIHLPRPEGERHFVIIGDVSGRGLTSGLTMMMSRAILLGVLEANPNADVSEAYRLLNRGMRKNLDRMNAQMYMSFMLLEVLGQGEFLAVGRHLPILIYRAGSGAVEEYEPQGVWLGIFNDVELDSLPLLNFRLFPNDVLTLYTDGVIERTTGQGMFGVDRLKQAIITYAPQGSAGLVAGVFKDLELYSQERFDDATVLAVTYHE